jgi:hypothetical protein
MEGADKKRRRVVLKIEAKIGLFMRSVGTLRYILSIIF